MKKIIIILAVVLAVIIAAVAILISPIAKNYVEKHSKEMIGRQVTMEHLFINIFTGGVSVRGLQIEAGANCDYKNFVELDTLKTGIRILPMISSRFIVSKVYLSGLKVQLWQKGGEFNFDDILAKFSDDDTEKPKEPETPSSWEVGIEDIKLRSSEVLYRDLLVGSDFDMQNISLDIPGVYFSDKSTDMGLHLQFEHGGELTTKMSYDIQSSKYNLNLKFKDYKIDAVLPYVRQYFNIGALNGLLTTDINVIGDTQHVMEFKVDGTVQIKDIDLTNDNGLKLVSASEARAQIKEALVGSNLYQLDSVSVSGVSMLFEIDKDGGNNFASIFKAEPAADTTKVVAQTTTNASANATTDASAQSEMRLSIGTLKVNDSQIQIKDNSLRNPFDYVISDLSVESHNFHLTGKNNVSIFAVMNGGGRAYMSWTGDPSDINNQNVILKLTNISITPFSPYMSHYFAYPITDGTFSVSSHNVVLGGNLQGANHLEAYKVEVGKKDKDVKPEYKVPMKTVLYILKDKKDKIDIALPISGNINSPEFSYRKIIVKTLINLMVKVATSPASFLGDALGLSKGADLQHLFFTPAQEVLTLEQHEKLKIIAQSLKDRPELNVAFAPEVNYNTSLRQMAMWELKKNYYLSLNPTKTADALQTIDIQTIVDISDKDKALNIYADSLAAGSKAAIADKAMTLYGKQAEALITASISRLDAQVKDYLVREGVAATRIKIDKTDIEKMKANTGATFYNVNLGMGGEAGEMTDSGLKDKEDE